MPANYIVEIKSDSTFVFTWQQGLIGGKTFGTISYKNNAFRMYSELQEDSVFYSVEIPPQTAQDYYEIKVVDTYGNPLPFDQSTIITLTSSYKNSIHT